MPSAALVPQLGNLAWEPLERIDRSEIFDRFNGVPTLGVVSADGQSHLFWRALGYVDDVSVWLYVPLTPEDQEYLDEPETPNLLRGIVLGSSDWRYVAVGVAERNKLCFEREWQLPADEDGESITTHLLEFMAEALRMALVQEPLPVSRRDVVQRASEAVSKLVSC